MPKPPVVRRRGGLGDPNALDQQWRTHNPSRRHRLDGPAWVMTVPGAMILRWCRDGAEVAEIHITHITREGGIWFANGWKERIFG